MPPGWRWLGRRHLGFLAATLALAMAGTAPPQPAAAELALAGWGAVSLGFMLCNAVAAFCAWRGGPALGRALSAFALPPLIVAAALLLP